MSHIAWETRARAKRAKLFAAIPLEWRLLTATLPESPNVIDLPRSFLLEEEIIITETTPLETLANIHAGIWSAEEVTRAFCHRAAVAHQLVNCLTEIVFDEALALARKLDEHRRMTGGLVGPLHGLPMSFMDRFRVAGAETAAGFISWLDHIEDLTSESLIVKYVRELGAVPFCKTNLPQTMMLAETTNNIVGRTSNPFLRTISSGGAAGGEGALLAMRGSPFGWATEIAGSGRIPAAFNCLYSLRVCRGRLPAKGIASTSVGLPICNATIAPISWDLSILKHIMKIALGSPAFEEDPVCVDMPWRESKIRNLNNRWPTFAVLRNDGFVRPTPPVQRALDLTVRSLQALGCEVVDWDPPAHAPAVQILFKIIGADGASGMRQAIKASGEPPVAQLKKWFFEQVNTPSLSTTDFWALCQSRAEFQAAYQAYWRSTSSKTSHKQPVDGVILPVTANSACPENELSYFGYSAIANLLDYTAAAFPVTFVDQALDAKKDGHVFLSEEDKSLHTSYNCSVLHGAPVGLQVMCHRNEEEVVLRLVEVISQAQALFTRSLEA